MKKPWSIEATNERVHTMRINWDRRIGWEQYVFLSADRHWDNPKSDWAMQQRHLNQCIKRHAPVIDVGDLFCAMQGKKDPRRTEKSLRVEHRVDNYFDALVSTAAEWFEPYKEIFALIGRGNHEVSVYRHAQTDLTARLCERLGVMAGRYGGYVVFRFESVNGGQSCSKKMRYFHGTGGAAPVTKGVIQTNRRAVMWPDADIVLAGHTHESWMLELVREKMRQDGTIYDSYQTHIQTPTYKKEHGEDGWHDQRGAAPKPMGGWWIRFYNDEYGKINYSAIRAK